MKRDTRSDILDMSKQLFNERGFNDVSIRDIAEALGISSGNLTYYFHKKEEIVEALIQEAPDTKPYESPRNIQELDSFFLDMQRTVQDNAFYFWHHAQLSQLSPKIREKQEKRYRQNVKMLKDAMQSLKLEGLIRSERFADEYHRVIDTLLLSNIYWIPFCVLKGSNAAEETYEHHAWAIMHHLLTEKGHEQVYQVLRK